MAGNARKPDRRGVLCVVVEQCVCLASQARARVCVCVRVRV